RTAVEQRPPRGRPHRAIPRLRAGAHASLASSCQALSNGPPTVVEPVSALLSAELAGKIESCKSFHQVIAATKAQMRRAGEMIWADRSWKWGQAGEMRRGGRRGRSRDPLPAKLR